MRKIIYCFIATLMVISCTNEKSRLSGNWYLSESLLSNDIGYMELEITADSVFVDLETHLASSDISISMDSIIFLDLRGKYKLLHSDTLILNDQFGGVFKFIRFTPKDLGYLSAYDLYHIRKFIYYSTHLNDLEDIEFIKSDLWDRFRFKNIEPMEDIEIERAQ